MTMSVYVPAWSGKQIAMVPDGYRPATEIRVPIVSDQSAATLLVKPNGEVHAIARSNKIGNGDNTPTNITISAVYPIG